MPAARRRRSRLLPGRGAPSPRPRARAGACMPSFQPRRLTGSATRQTRLHVVGSCTLSNSTRDAKRCKRLQLGGTVAAVGLFHQFLLPGAIDARLKASAPACC